MCIIYTHTHCLNECTLCVQQKGLELYQSCLRLWQASRHRLSYYYIIALYNCVMLSGPKLFHLFCSPHRFVPLDGFVCVFLYAKIISWLNSQCENIHSALTNIQTRRALSAYHRASTSSSSSSLVSTAGLIIVLRVQSECVRACVSAR